MFLTASEIASEVEAGHLQITPYSEALLKPASYIVRFGSRFSRWSATEIPIQPWAASAAERHLEAPIEIAELTIQAGDFVLGCTKEFLSLPEDLVGILYNLSHWARFGVSTLLETSLVGPAFGNPIPTALTLELTSMNPSPIRIKAGLPACHLAFVRLEQDDRFRFLKSPYDGRQAPSAPRLYEEFCGTIFRNAETTDDH